jgi:Flp pilus assembly protein TadD
MHSVRGKIPAFVLGLAFAWGTAHGQAPSAVQVFMPNGERPARELRFTLTRDDGRVETLFTDSKGKFQMTGDLAVDREYSITIEGDRRSFETTTTRFRILRGGITYIPIFLNPYRGEPRPKAGVLDAISLDADVPSEARSSYGQAMKAVGEGRVDEAIRLFNAALSIHPKYLRALNDLGVLYLKLNRLNEAATTLERALKVNKGFHFVRLNLGVVLTRQGKYKEAVEILKPLTREEPPIEGMRMAYAEALIGLGNLAEAEAALKAALQETGADRARELDARFKLGLVLSRSERYAEAVSEFEKVIALDPTAANAHLLLGAALLQLKKLAEAERQLLKAYELGGAQVGNAQLFLGQLYLTQQAYPQALRAFEQYLKDVPDAANASQIKQTIEQIKIALKRN